LDVDVVEDDDERKPAKCAMESIIRSKRRGFLTNIVCVCACVCVCHFVLKMRSKKVRQKNILAQVEYLQPVVSFIRPGGGRRDNISCEMQT
jgi:hypothetical protein